MIFFFCLQPWARHYRWSVTFAITIGLFFLSFSTFQWLCITKIDGRARDIIITILFYTRVFFCVFSRAPTRRRGKQPYNAHPSNSKADVPHETTAAATIARIIIILCVASIFTKRRLSVLLGIGDSVCLREVTGRGILPLQ